MSNHLLNNHRRFTTNDLDHARDVLGQVWERHDIQVNRGWQYSVRWHQVDLRHAGLSYTDSPTSLHIVSSPMGGNYRFGIHLSGYATHRLNGNEASLSPSVASLHAPGQRLEADTQPFRALILNLDGRFVEPALQRRFGKVPPFEEWAREFDVTAGPAACLKSMCHWMAYEIDQPTSWLRTSARTADGLERVLRSLFLDCLEERRPAAKNGENSAATRQLQRVEDWLDAHFADPVSIDDMAEIAGVSVRSLQAAFRRLRDCTPMQALAHRRLAAARQALQTASPEATVTQVATDCGFFHFGRFASQYRRAFGETPSTTLARARRR